MAKEKSNGGNLGFGAKLWLTADKLRNNMDAAEYKHVVLGLIFLKYISDSFEEHRTKLLGGQGDYAGANAEDPDEYKAENVFWVPAEARWSYLQTNAKQSTIGQAFAKTIAPLFAQIRTNTEQFHALATLRDTLLPNLLSGELSVANLQS